MNYRNNILLCNSSSNTSIMVKETAKQAYTFSRRKSYNKEFRSNTTKFKKDVSACIKFLAKAFNKIGAKEVESFLHLIEMDAPQPSAYAPASTPDVAGLDMNFEVKQKRKAVAKDLNVAVSKRRKDICRTFYPCTLTSFFDFTLAKVLVEEGEEVERGQPLYIKGQRKPYVCLGLDNEEDVLKRQFEIDMLQQPKEWVDKICEEWRILAEYLPETIFVRVYEDRMDLLRALVHYRSGGLGINPNLYKRGKVLLSLPKTSCGQEIMWVLGSSTILQLLVSIQHWILNAKPLFNDMKYSVLSGSFHGEESSVLYNRNTFIKTLKTMVYTMKSLPKNFEVFAVGHFRNLYGDILAACEKEAKETGSVTFKNDLNACIQQLAAAFSMIEPKKLPSSQVEMRLVTIYQVYDNLWIVSWFVLSALDWPRLRTDTD
nr:hypothetical protein [Tanacetum cinerariifolium]